jgi:hypothetical protein
VKSGGYYENLQFPWSDNEEITNEPIDLDQLKPIDEWFQDNSGEYFWGGNEDTHELLLNSSRADLTLAPHEVKMIWSNITLSSELINSVSNSPLRSI